MFGVNNRYSFILLFFTFPALSDAIEKSCEGIETSKQVAQCAEYKKTYWMNF